ncbi:MAG: serine/threonine-protein kinase, partial [Longimicrobiales bacterium]|nr:serine/threonine-protein kinase [Longimicrobiales bacterium]
AIARLLDAGVTREGHPWLITEYVEGVGIDVHVSVWRRTLPERLSLFLQVAAAVEHAHSRLIVHQDLKPSNIRVQGDGTVKLLDFGIARVLEGGVAGCGTPGEVPDARWLTPRYAAPEQAAGKDPATSVDVYQLGLLLHELIAGRHPNDAPPSGEESGFLPGLEADLRASAGAARVPELAAVIRTALAPNPRDRYRSVHAMVEDVERFRRGEPVRAYRGSRLHAGRLLVRRNRVASIALTAALGAVIMGSGVALWQAHEAGRERDEAERARARAEAALAQARTSMGLLRDLMQVADPRAVDFGGAEAARTLIQTAEALIPTLDDEPSLQLPVLEVLARLHMRFGDLEAAEALARKGLAVALRGESGGNETFAGPLLLIQAEAAQRASRYDAAEAAARSALELRLATEGPQGAGVAEALILLGRQVGYQDMPVREALLEQAIEIRRGQAPVDRVAVATDLLELGRVLRSQGKRDQAEAAYRSALTIRRDLLGPDHPAVAEALVVLGDLVYDFDGDPPAAEALYREALRIQERSLDPEHPQPIHALGSLARLLSEQGRWEESEAFYRASLARRRRAYGPAHPTVAEGLGHLAMGYLRAGRLGPAERYAREALDLWIEIRGPDHTGTASGHADLGEVLLAGGNLDGAAREVERGLAIRRARLGGRHIVVGIALAQLGRVRRAQGRSPEARALLADALDIVSAGRDPDHPDVRAIRGELDVLDGRVSTPPAPRSP